MPGSTPLPLEADAKTAAANGLLGALTGAARDRLTEACDHLEVQSGQILFDVGADVTHAYFPEGPTLVSYLVELADGTSVETALVGREGAIGGIVSGGFLPAFSQTMVQYPGPMKSVKLERLDALRQAFPDIDALFARYADCLLAQIFQATACAAGHGVAARTARWLVQAHKRTGSATIPITQQRLADILGVGRSYIARVITRLADDGLIKPQRGRLIIAKPGALRRAACGCDDLVEQHFSAVIHAHLAG